MTASGERTALVRPLVKRHLKEKKELEIKVPVTRKASRGSHEDSAPWLPLVLVVTKLFDCIPYRQRHKCASQPLKSLTRREKEIS